MEGVNWAIYCKIPNLITGVSKTSRSVICMTELVVNMCAKTVMLL